MKKNKMMRIASVLLVAVLLSTCAISGTFAKYTSKATASDTARVAKWDIEVEDTNIAVTGAQPTVTFDLFNCTDTNVDTDGSGAEKVIAPGTAGSFELTIENLSEVKAKYTIELSETNAGNIPLKYSIDNTTWVDSVAELTMTALTDQEIGMNATKNQTVYWKWVFEGTAEGAHAGQTDATDTELGIAGTATVTITATITVTQVD